jgi:hypothetical protein
MEQLVIVLAVHTSVFVDQTVILLVKIAIHQKQ